MCSAKVARLPRKNRKKTKRRVRHEEFRTVQPGWSIAQSLSAALLNSSWSLLTLSLHDRRGRVSKVRDNHYSGHAPGAIVVLVAGLEAWLNEGIRLMGFSNSEKLDLADEPIAFKHREIPAHFGGEQIKDQRDLNLLLSVRDEIVHFLPRDVKGHSSVDIQVPTGLERLYEERIFYVPEHVARDQAAVITLAQLLCSYKLAYWAFGCVERSVKDFLRACSELEQQRLEWGAKNFELYKSRVLPPERLSEYDQRFGLEVTQK